MGTTRSGWCLRELTPGSKPEHNKCPKNFTSGTCSCSCDHVGEREPGWAGGGARDAVETGVRKVAKESPSVYTERVPTEGGAEALVNLNK